jgi:hypothetical protein
MHHLLITGLCILGLAGTAAASPNPITSPEVHQQLAKVRQATAKYHNLDQAIADGYLPTEVCVELPGVGGMGYHFANPALLEDDTVDPLFPEVLLYARIGGRLHLVAVEYVVFDTGQPAPYLFGQRFDGPMPGHEPGMPVHYDLHAWLWHNNPDGIFAQYNPRIRCPE